MSAAEGRKRKPSRVIDPDVIPVLERQVTLFAHWRLLPRQLVFLARASKTYPLDLYPVSSP